MQPSQSIAGIIKAKQLNGAWYLVEEGTSAYGVGDTLDEALSAMIARQQEFAEFQQTSGFMPIDERGAHLAVRRWIANIWPTVRLLLVVGLICIPISMAISYGLVRASKKIEDRIGKNFESGRGVLRAIDKIVLNIGSKKHELGPDEYKDLQEALSRLAARYQVVSDAVAKGPKIKTHNHTNTEK